MTTRYADGADDQLIAERTRPWNWHYTLPNQPHVDTSVPQPVEFTRTVLVSRTYTPYAKATLPHVTDRMLTRTRNARERNRRDGMMIGAIAVLSLVGMVLVMAAMVTGVNAQDITIDNSTATPTAQEQRFAAEMVTWLIRALLAILAVI